MFGKKERVNGESQIFTLYDAKVCVYKDPILAINEHDVIRQISSMMKDPQHATNHIVSNAEDFQLFRVGYWNKQTGAIDPINPEHIANLHEIKAAIRIESGPRALSAT